MVKRKPVSRYMRRPARRASYRRNAYYRSAAAPGGNMIGVNAASRARRLTRARAQRSQVRVPRFLLAQVDPFAREAVHARVPDDSTAPSSSFYTYDELAMSCQTLLGNASAQWFWPNPRYNSVAAVSASSNSWTWPASYGGAITNAKYSQVVAQYRLSRPVGHGVRISCSLAPTSTTGFCHVGLYTMSDFNVTTWTLPLSIADMVELPYYRRVTLASLTQNPIIVCNKYLDQTAFRYTDVSSAEAVNAPNSTFHVPNSWMGILIACEGHGQAAGAQIVNVETICHFEGQSLFGGISTDSNAEPGNIQCMQGAAHAVAESDPVTSDQPAAKQSKIAKAVNDFADAAGEAVGRHARDAGARFGDFAATAAIGAAASAGIAGVNNIPGRLAGY